MLNASEKLSTSAMRLATSVPWPGSVFTMTKTARIAAVYDSAQAVVQAPSEPRYDRGLADRARRGGLRRCDGSTGIRQRPPGDWGRSESAAHSERSLDKWRDNPNRS